MLYEFEALANDCCLLRGYKRLSDQDVRSVLGRDRFGLFDVGAVILMLMETRARPWRFLAHGLRARRREEDMRCALWPVFVPCDPPEQYRCVTSRLPWVDVGDTRHYAYG